jgi:signal transduction histidine kinase/CheY-like chemotaxis protein/ligand-binding sensor domain-containing protein
MCKRQGGFCLLGVKGPRKPILCIVSVYLTFSSFVATGYSSGWGDLESGIPVIEVFQGNDVPASNSVRGIVQDQNGFLYVGDEGGILRFDGVHWLHIEAPGCSRIQMMAVDGRGRIWAGGFECLGYFESNGDGVLKYVSLLDFVPVNYRPVDFWGVYLTAKGVVFVGSDKVLRWNAGKFEVWTLPLGHRSTSQQIGDIVYITTGLGSGLWTLDATGVKLFLPFKDGNVFFIKPLNDGSSLALTSLGFGVFDGKELLLSAPEGELAKNLIKNHLTFCSLIDDKTLAIGTWFGGVVIADFHGAILKVIDHSSGLPDQGVTGMGVDREGNLWVATLGGLSRIEADGAVTVFNKTNHLNGRFVRSVAANGDRFMVATMDGIFELQRSDLHEPLLFKMFDDKDVVLGDTLLSDKEGILVGSPSGIHIVLADGSTKPVYQDVVGIYLLVRSRSVQDRVYFLDTAGLGWIDKREGKWIRSGKIVIDDLFSSLTEGPDCGLWVGLDRKGVLRIDPRTGARCYYTVGDANPEELGSVTVGILHGRILLGTGSGFFSRKTESGSKFYRCPGLEAVARVYALSDTLPNGNLWAAVGIRLPDGSLHAAVGTVAITPDGLFVWNDLALSALSSVGKPTMVYSQEEQGSDPILWVGGTDGLLRVSVHGLRSHESFSQVVLEGVASDFKGDIGSLPVNPRDAVILPYERHHIKITFTSPVFRDAKVVRFQSRLSGLDDQWTTPSAERSRVYGNLQPGDYLFNVRSIGSDNKSSGSAVYRFVVLPPWYRTSWSYMTGGLIFGGLLYAGYLQRVRKIRARNTELEALVAQRTEELAAANAAKSEFVAHLSHEIRNPLNGVLGICSMLNGGELNPRQRYLTGVLVETSEQLGSLLGDILDFSRIERGEVVLDEDVFCLQRSVEAAIHSVDFRMQSTTLSQPSEPVWLRGDGGKLKQIVLNLVTNALKYGNPKQAEVVCSVQNGTDLDEQVVSISVKNRGTTLSEDELRSIFEPFKRGTAAKKTGSVGAGLGLTVSRKIARAMKGDLVARSAEGVTEFTLQVRAGTAAQPDAISTGSRSPIGGRALGIEDEDYNRLVLGHIFGEIGLEVDWATTGESGIAMALEGSYDIIFTDWELPDVPGPEVARRILEKHPAPPPPIIAVTAYATQDRIDICRQAGMAGVIIKPVTKAKMREALKALGPLAGRSRSTCDLAALKRLGDPATVAVEFRSTMFAYWARAELSLDKEDDAAAGEVHRLRGQVQIVKASRLAEQLGLLEAAIRRACWEEVGPLRLAVRQELELVGGELSRVRAT